MGKNKLCQHGVLGAKKCPLCRQSWQRKYRQSPKAKVSSRRYRKSRKGKTYRNNYEKKNRTHGATYISAVTCPKCGRRGGLVSCNSTNSRTGKTWRWYRVQHLIWDSVLYKKLKLQGFSKAQVVSQVRSGKNCSLSDQEVLTLLGYLP